MWHDSSMICVGIMKEKNFYTTKDLVKILGISRQSVLKRIHRENIKSVKTGRDFIVFKKDIDLKKIKTEIKR
jgi:hypothetical protein